MEAERILLSKGTEVGLTFDLAKQSSVAAVKKHLYADIHELLTGHENGD